MLIFCETFICPLTAPFMGFLHHRRATINSADSAQAASSVVEGTWRGGMDLDDDDLHVDKRDASGLVMGADYVSKHKDTLVGAVDVYFGCRHKDHDWLYSDDMERLKQDGIITRLYTAFSRDNDGNSNGDRRKYVQDVMRLEEECVSRLQTLILEKNASVYVCGDGNAMAKDVQAALTDILSKKLHDEGGEEAARLYIDKMKSEKRYLQDIWTS